MIVSTGDMTSRNFVHFGGMDDRNVPPLNISISNTVRRVSHTIFTFTRSFFLLDSIGSERFSFIQREDDTFLSLCLLPAVASCGQQPCAAVTSTVTKATKPLSDEFSRRGRPGRGRRQSQGWAESGLQFRVSSLRGTVMITWVDHIG